MEADALPGSVGELDPFVRLWNRESVLMPLALLIEASGPEDSPHASLTQRFVDRLECPVALSADEAVPRWSEAMITIPVTRAGADAQEAAWNAAFGSGHEALARRLSGAFDFGPGAISRIATAAPVPLDDVAVWRSCVASVRPRLDPLAQRVEARASWDDLVLPADQQAMLRQIVDQVGNRRQVYDDWGYSARMSRGLGITALFTGESGTGKTMAAEVLAGELGVEPLPYRSFGGDGQVYRRRRKRTCANCSMRRNTAVRCCCSTRRTRCSASAARSRTATTATPTSRSTTCCSGSKASRGLAILATNLKASLDSAFMRRMRFVVSFPHPGPAERKAMWQRAFPASVPLATLHYDRLARINLTGGHIVAAALNAAFLAAAADRKVGMQDVLQAARAELVKLNRPINAADFVVPAGPVAGECGGMTIRLHIARLVVDPGALAADQVPAFRIALGEAMGRLHSPPAEPPPTSARWHGATGGADGAGDLSTVVSR